MSWTKGWNFRLTSGFVTDTGNNTYDIGSDGTDYPQTRNGVTFGFNSSTLSGIETRDRNSGIDEKFAGLCISVSPSFPPYFQVDLPATGSYVIRLSLGDRNYSSASYGANFYAEVRDNTSVLATIDASTSAGDHYLDATGVERTSTSDWITNNASITQTFATTTFIIKTADGSTKSGAMTHLDLDQVITAVAPGPGLHERLIGRGIARGVQR